MSIDRRQEFLATLAQSSQPAPAQAPPAQTASSEPATEPAPLSFEQQPPAAEQVPAALAAVADDAPAPAPALMDLGHDAQLQGTALGLHSIGQRLTIVAEGLKLIPILAGVASDLERLNYGEVAKAVDTLVAWAQDEERSLMAALEQRTSARQGQPPPAA